ncbi:beta-glucosidase BglX [Ginsengibacter hankyongi]|uniref:Periplasmic beta-glucosidase n=1 Tax=Ginsengibacter hankyongi TaxID=2607284 RepID=A0A5J5IGK4_9BACT|nr:beta-glucosidase BglX [Ginsengibacter hankyongi]KAA9038210.1 beta-glucosidase BglX [Ginsengibacter hankyongi]
MKKTIVFLVFAFVVSLHGYTQSNDAKMKTFIDALMKKMTLDEKIGQLNLPGSGDIVTGQAGNSDIGKKIKEGKVGGLFNIKSEAKIRAVQQVAVDQSRLKIPLIFGMDVIHGYETVFPIPLGLSCTWDMGLIQKSASIAASEASADGICWTFSPMVDIARDPRWGRIAEGSGEDPYLGSQIAKAMVRGYQGNDLTKNNTIMACVKHYALYGAAEAGRDYNTTDMGHLRMFNEYLPPYKAAVDAGAGSVMASFNEVDGVPATANKFLLTDVLRKRWGFNGFVVTDYTGINEMVAHGIGDLQTVSARALMAGIDMDMVGEGFLTTLKKSLQQGKVTQQQIDFACRKILEAKYKLGLFDDPYRYCNAERAKTEIFTDANRNVARDIAAQSFVLLKNNNVLPLKKSGTIALIGPLADNKENMPGTWSVAADFSKAVSVLQGLKNVAGPGVNILYAKGSNLSDDTLFEQRAGMFGKSFQHDNRPDQEIINEALDVANKSDVIVAALGESAEMTGESSSRSDITIPAAQENLLKALVKTGKPLVLVLFTGRPLAIKWEQDTVPSILNVWFGGTEAGNAIGDVLFGDVNPSGKLTTTWPQNVGQVPLYYNHKNTGRPLPEGKWFEKFRSNYLDVSNDPVYPFGFGLSYTSFSYGDVQLSNKSLKGNQTLTASVKLTNTGTWEGKETVQLYIRDVVGSITRPVEELKGFQKIDLKAGESKTVSFKITPEDLKFYNGDLKYDWEPGEFVIMIGANSRDVKSASINWVK